MKQTLCDQCGNANIDIRLTTNIHGNYSPPDDYDFCDQSCLAHWLVDQERKRGDYLADRVTELLTADGKKRR